MCAQVTKKDTSKHLMAQDLKSVIFYSQLVLVYLCNKKEGEYSGLFVGSWQCFGTWIECVISVTAWPLSQEYCATNSVLWVSSLACCSHPELADSFLSYEMRCICRWGIMLNQAHLLCNEDIIHVWVGYAAISSLPGFVSSKWASSLTTNKCWILTPLPFSFLPSSTLST